VKKTFKRKAEKDSSKKGKSKGKRPIWNDLTCPKMRETSFGGGFVVNFRQGRKVWGRARSKGRNRRTAGIMGRNSTSSLSRTVAQRGFAAART